MKYAYWQYSPGHLSISMQGKAMKKMEQNCLFFFLFYIFAQPFNWFEVIRFPTLPVSLSGEEPGILAGKYGQSADWLFGLSHRLEKNI
jgi:hypothetical protein